MEYNTIKKIGTEGILKIYDLVDAVNNIEIIQEKFTAKPIL